MKTHTFTVTVKFSEGMPSDDDIAEVANNIANSLAHTADTAGLAPDGADFYTEGIKVTPQFLPVTIELVYDFNKGWTNK